MDSLNFTETHPKIERMDYEFEESAPDSPEFKTTVNPFLNCPDFSINTGAQADFLPEQTFVGLNKASYKPSFLEEVQELENQSIAFLKQQIAEKEQEIRQKDQQLNELHQALQSYEAQLEDSRRTRILTLKASPDSDGNEALKLALSDAQRYNEKIKIAFAATAKDFTNNIAETSGWTFKYSNSILTATLIFDTRVAFKFQKSSEGWGVVDTPIYRTLSQEDLEPLHKYQSIPLFLSYFVVKFYSERQHQ